MMFLAKALQASRVNLLMNDFAAGLPSPLAFLGLGEAIGRALGVPHWSVGVLPILHSVAVSPGRTRAEAAPKSGQFSPVEIPEDLTGSVTVSLLLDLPDCSDEHQVAEAFCGRRIAGGPINNEAIVVLRATPDGSVFKTLKRGYALIRTTPPKSNAVSTGRIYDLRNLAAALYPAVRESGSGWFVPVAVGHRLLENPANVSKRANTRDPTMPHVFTEPAVGIGELVSVRNKRLTELNEVGLSKLLWRWTAEGDWIVGHSNYHPNSRVAAKTEDFHGQSN